ncbi:MAG: response regulator transcription factor [Phycisphaerales bacterium]|nr:MAG: response regulator transcription factor [Phycisphaerales bacterium]
MRVLIAEDAAVSRRVLEATLRKSDYEVLTTCDGTEAWEALEKPDAPRLLILDWMMPGMAGPEICAALRKREDGDSFYIILLTAKTQKQDIVEGLKAGADDYLTKPFHRDELLARLSAGRRIIELQQRLAVRIGELEQALAEVKQLSGLLPICAYCKRIRGGEDYWQAVEEYITSHSHAQFSHGVCPECYEKHVRPELDQLQ